MRHRLRELLPLLPVMALSALAGAIFSLKLTEFVVMPDELGYVKQAVEMAHGELVLPGDFWFNSWGQLHSVLMAPAYRWLNTVHAFDVNHVINAVVMATTAIPAYLLAKRVTPSALAAYLVAAIAVAVPWIAMAGSMMTEVVAYPAFTWAALAMTHAIERPSARSELLVLAALGIAFFSRTQLIVLAPAYVAAFLAHGLLHEAGSGPGLRGRLRAIARGHRLFMGLSVIGALGMLVVASPDRFLGGYAEPTNGPLFPPGSATAARELVVYVVGAIGVIPLALAAAWIATTLGRRAPRGEHAAASVILVVCLVMTAVGGAFTVRYTAGINDRYLFYVIPLLLAGTAGALSRPASRGSRIALGAAGLATAWLFATSLIIQQGPSLVAPSMAFHTVMWQRAADLGTTAPHLLGWIAAIGTVALVLLAGRPLVLPVVLGLLLLFCVTETQYTMRKVAATQANSAPAFLARRGWIDRALPENAQAASVLASLGPPAATTADWWDVSFWNEKVRTVYVYPGGSQYSQNFASTLTIDPLTGRVPELDRFAYIVRHANDTRFGLFKSTTFANDGGIFILQAERPYRAEWTLDGPDRDSGFVPAGATAKLRVYTPSKEGDGQAEVVLGAPGAEQDVIAELRAGSERTEVVVPAGGRGAGKIRVPYRSPGYADITISVRGGDAGVQLVGVNQA